MKYAYSVITELPIGLLLKVMAQVCAFFVFITLLYQSFIGLEFLSSKLLFPKEEPKIAAPFSSYDFSKAKPFFRSANPKFLSAIDKTTLEYELLLSMPPKIRARAAHYIDDILAFSSAHNLDPVWVLAIIWTESHFSPVARSSVQATGLMQIMPGTGIFLAELLDKEVRLPIKKHLVDPKLNIELGTFYLKRLLKRFRSHRLATVAYNMGPSFVRRRLRTGEPIGRKNIYYSKVKKYYRFLLRAVHRLENQSREHGLSSIVSYKVPKNDIHYYLGNDLAIKLLPAYASQ